MKKSKYLVLFLGLFLFMNVNMVKAADKTCTYFAELDMLGKNQDMGSTNSSDPNTLRGAINAKLTFNSSTKKAELSVETSKGQYTKLDYNGSNKEALVLSYKDKKYGIDTYKSKSFQKVKVAYYISYVDDGSPDKIYSSFVSKGSNSCPKIFYHEEANLAEGSYYRGTLGFSYTGEKYCTGESGMTDYTCTGGSLQGQTAEEEKTDGTKVKTSCTYSLPPDKFGNTASFEVSFNVTNSNAFLFNARSRNNSGEGTSLSITNSMMSANKFESVRVADSVTGTVNGQYYIGAYGSTFKKVFTQTESQKNSQSITCPSNVYAVEEDKALHKIAITLENKSGAVALSKGSMEDNGYETEDRANDDSKDSITVYRIRKPSIKVNLNITENGCDVLGDDLKEWLQWFLDVIRIGGIVLSVVLGIADYIKAIASADKDALNKSNKNLSTRVICVGLLFLIPIVVEFVLQLVNIGVTADNPRCDIN